MEGIEEQFKEWIKSYGYGSGSGSGDGSGSGSGSGYGYGYGSGSGYGSGYGYGDGYGDGYGYGSGSGSGYGYGDGYGDGDGYGYGSGSGYGYGSGSGSGSGSGYGDGFSLEKIQGKTVFEIDGMAFIPEHVRINFVAGISVSKKDFSEAKCFLGKYGNCIAHGETIKEAMLSAQEKYFSGIDFEQKKFQLLKLFEKKKKLTVKELFGWHGLLTGSCRFGRSEFQKEHNLKDGDLLSLSEFVRLTENSFGGDKIRQLLQSEEKKNGK